MKRSGWIDRRTDVRLRRQAVKRRKVATAAVSKASLDKLARRLVVELRDKNTCQRCGNDQMHPSGRHWAHIRAGRALTLYLWPWAAFCLCYGCHEKYAKDGDGARGSESRRWLAEKFPDRELKLTMWEQEKKRPKFDPVGMRAYLQAEIAKYERVGS